jgi:hypothetical protein
MTITIDRVNTDLPPLDVIKCQCNFGCPFAQPCEEEATCGQDDDILCAVCRYAKEQFEKAKSEASMSTGWDVFSRHRAVEKVRYYLRHCHSCDYDEEKEDMDAS